MALGGPNIHPRVGAWLGIHREIYPLMRINCPCGKQATWILLYGCGQNHHMWEDHLCRTCLTAKTGVDRLEKIRDRIYTNTKPWTCLNIHYQDPNGNDKWIQCEVTRWYAKEITPDILNTLYQEYLRKNRNITRQGY